MQIDVTAMLQGLGDARDKNEVSENFADKIYSAVREISYRGPVGRQVCDYDKLLMALSAIEPEYWIEASMLWKRLGNSLSSGITVAN